MKKSHLIVMVGNIASGKSTYIKDLVKKGYVVVCKDGIRYSLGGGEYIFNPKYEPGIHEATMKLFVRLLLEGENIVIDETNMTVKTRKPYMIHARMTDYKITAVITKKTTLKTALSRKKKANKPGGR